MGVGWGPTVDDDDGDLLLSLGPGLAKSEYSYIHTWLWTGAPTTPLGRRMGEGWPGREGWWIEWCVRVWVGGCVGNYTARW